LIGVAAIASVAAMAVPGCTREHSAQPAAKAAQSGAAAQEARRVRVGTYDSRAVAIAYARSEEFSQSMKELMARHAKAKTDGDAALVKQLEEEGQSQQVRLHLQGFSNAPVAEAFDPIRARLPEVAQKVGVVAIVPMADYQDPSVEMVDVTDDLVALFKPSEQTLKIVKDMKGTKPLPIEQVARMPAGG
jgi:hypothetical protein